MMMKILTFACLTLLPHGGVGASSIEPSLIKALQRGRTANVVVTMRDSTSTVLEGFKGRNFATRGDRITVMATELEELAAKSQANVIAFLEEELSRSDGGCSYRSFWISNQIFIRGASQELVEKLGAFNEIESIAESVTVGGTCGWTSEKPAALETEPAPRGWNIERIHARQVWEEERDNGTGIVIADIGGGVEMTHEALRNNYRRSHGWFDYNDGTEEPFDYRKEGTGVMGTAVGANDIGVAPGSQWIACKYFGSTRWGWGQEARIACGQWVLCPTDFQGGNRNCSMAPHVVVNGWGVGGGHGEYYRAVTDAWYAAGIIPIFTAGDNYQECGSIISPADYDKVIAVAATDVSDNLSEFSLVGPSRLTSEFKPDVVAPGMDILTAHPETDTHYSYKSGSWMATPHVAGTVALMLASRPHDRPCFESVRDALRQSCEAVHSKGLSCDGVGDHERPNYHHGYGLINALSAVRIYKNMTLSCS